MLHLEPEAAKSFCLFLGIFVAVDCIKDDTDYYKQDLA